MSKPAPRPTDNPQESQAAALARLYDLDLIDDPGDLDLYLALAGRTGGPILELAAGSGRLAVPLAVAGHSVTAVDLDPAMLTRARERARAFRASAPKSAAKAAKPNLDLELVEADILDLELPSAGTFQLGFIALNSLFLLATRDAQRRAFRTLAGHLAPGGVAVVDVWLPEPDDLARFDGRMIFEYERIDPATGHEVTKVASARYDPTTAVVDLTTIFEEGPPGGSVVRWIRRDALRLVGPDELATMAADAGLEIELIAGDYDMEPIRPGSERAILIARGP